jgi:ATP-dependent DNA ligase
LRWKSKPDRIATLLLGLYRDDGGLDYVGSAAVAASRHDQIAERVLPLIDQKSDRRFSEPNRWGTGELEEAAVKPKLVAEVRYDKVQGNRFRHGTKLIRFRPDKDPEQCTWREVRPALRKGDPTVESLLESRA